MRQNFRTIRRPVMAVLISLALSPLANATTTDLNGTGTMTYSFQAISPNTSPTPPPGGNDYELAVPGTYIFGDSFSSNQSSLTPLATSSVGAYTFMDSYRFSIAAGAGGDTLVTSLSLGSIVSMTNLQFRLYEVASSTTAPVIPGPPAGSKVITLWNGQSGVDTSGTDITKSFSGLQAGTYILDVAGIASGSAGGSYVGTANLEPVPLPGAVWLMLSGLGVLGAALRKQTAWAWARAA